MEQMHFSVTLVYRHDTLVIHVHSHYGGSESTQLLPVEQDQEQNQDQGQDQNQDQDQDLVEEGT